MYKFGLAYYQANNAERIPVTGLTVKFVRPGGTWASGLLAPETSPGYYELTILAEADAGFYHIWDNTTNQAGAFSGKTAIVGPLDAAGFQQSDYFLALVNELDAKFATMHQVYGADIYIQDTQPNTINDYMWLDTTGVEFITE